MDELARLKNIGETSAAWLHEAGILTYADLERVGAVEAWRRVKALYPNRVSLLMLYALQGALLDLHWNALPPDMKAELKAQAEQRS